MIEELVGMEMELNQRTCYQTEELVGMEKVNQSILSGRRIGWDGLEDNVKQRDLSCNRRTGWGGEE